MAKSSFRSRRSGRALVAPPIVLPSVSPEVPRDGSLAPVGLSWLTRWGDGLARAGDWPAAAIAYGAALAANPTDWRSALALGSVELRRDRPQAAAEALALALALEPENLAVLLGASEAQERLGIWPEAEALALRAWLAHPDRPEPARRLARLDRLCQTPFEMVDSWRGRLADHWLGALAERLDRADRLTSLDSTGDRPFAAQIDAGAVWHWRGAIGIFDAQDRLVLQVSDGNLPGWLRAQPPRPEPALRVAGRVAVVAGGEGDRFDRWFQEVLPRLQVLADCGESWDQWAAVVVDRLDCAFQTETLDRLGIPRDRILELDRHCHIQADTLIVPRRFNGPSSYGIAALQALLPSPRPRRHRRWVLCSAPGSDRPWVNGPEVAIDLARWGFDRLDPQACSVAELIEAFQEAEAIVAPSHPALVLLALCAPETTLIEVGSRDYLPLARLVGLDGRSIAAEPSPSGPPASALWVRSAEVRAVLARCLKRGLRA